MKDQYSFSNEKKIILVFIFCAHSLNLPKKEITSCLDASCSETINI